MKFNITGILFLFFLFTGGIACAQSMENIKRDKEKSEKEINYLNQLLDETKSSKTVSIGKLSIIREQITQSKRVINSLNQEVQYLEKQIGSNEQRIGELLSDKETVLSLYAKLVYGLWKKKDKTNKMMFIFSSSDFNQAYNRYKYFEQIQSYSRKQLTLIARLNDSLQIKNDELKKFIALKNVALDDIGKKNKDLEIQRSSENQLIAQFQQKEKEITRKLQAERKNREKLEKELNRLIAAQAKKSGTTSSSFKMTPEEKLISDDFEKNRGKLPWPVNQGIISEKFGINIHPVYRRVEMENSGISITTLKGADVRSVFNGVVSEIIFMPGFNNTLIIRHGNYFTVYSNLVDVQVKKDQKVTTKQTIGKVAYDDEKGSVLNFQVWKYTGKETPEKQNPEYWLAK